MSETRICILTWESFGTEGLEDLCDLNAFEIFECPECGGKHSYRNGRPSIAPVNNKCRYCGENAGVRRFCSSDCRNKALHEASKNLKEMLG